MRTVFLIAPIGHEDSAARQRTNRLEKYILEPALKGLDVRIVRADKINEPGVISRQLMDQLVHAEVVIADITDLNANVFYEMGIRHALGKPILHLRYNDSLIPFDVSDFRTISYGFDPEDIETCIPMIQAFFTSADEMDVKNPFSVSTESYLVVRGDDSYTKFRSLDIVQGLAGQFQQMQYLASIAEPGVEYWVQGVQSTSFPNNGEDLISSAVSKGATFKVLLRRNPPFSGRLYRKLTDLNRKIGGVRVALSDDADLRVLGMGVVYCLVSPAMDGRYGSIIIKDQSIIRYLKSSFDAKFEVALND